MIAIAQESNVLILCDMIVIDTKVLRCGLCKKTYLNKENFDLHVCVDEKEDSENVSSYKVL